MNTSGTVYTTCIEVRTSQERSNVKAFGVSLSRTLKGQKRGGGWV